MQQLADRVLPVASRGRVWKLISLATVCSNWLVAAGAAGWLVALASLFISVAQGMQLWLEHLVYCASGVMVKVAFFYAKTASGVFRRFSRTGFALPLTTD